VSDTVIECVRLPLVPVIVRLYVPLGNVPEVDTLSVTLVPVVEAGVKEAVALAGNPVTVNATAPVNPYSRVIVTLSAGDAFFATFERPADGLACAWAIRSAVRALGLETRTGLHRGECEMRGEQPSGLAVHTAARVMAAAGEGEILVSDALREALEASDFSLSDRGRHELRGVPGEWQLYAAEPMGKTS
jgi:class 3 adenylate cyclase